MCILALRDYGNFARSMRLSGAGEESNFSLCIVFSVCVYTSESATLKVIRVVLPVMKRKWTSGLYYLRGRTIIGSAAAVSFTLLQLDQTRLLHVRLRYMLEIGMNILTERALLCG